MTTSERMASGEQTMEKTAEQARIESAAEAARGQAMERALNDSLQNLIKSVRPDAIFGAPVERQGVTVIPCAEVWSSFGMGGGTGFGPAAAPTGAPAERATTATGTGGGSGAGGGGGARGRPVAVVTITQGQARVLPVVDVTKFMIAGLTTVGFITFWLSQAAARSRGRRRGVLSAARFARALRGPTGRAV